MTNLHTLHIRFLHSERQWGTVREDYSATGDAWNYFPHDHARSRAYRWGEDGLMGLTVRLMAGQCLQLPLFTLFFFFFLGRMV